MTVGMQAYFRRKFRLTAAGILLSLGLVKRFPKKE